MNEYVPISKIEANLGMPPTTLQKVLKGVRPLPKKWEKKLEAYFVREPSVNAEPPKQTKPTLPIKEDERPVQQEGESLEDYLNRLARWKANRK